MRGTVKIGATDVGMLANAASPIIYKRVFHKDFLRGLNNIQTEGNETEGVDLFTEMGFVMAMQDCKTLQQQAHLCEDDYLEWLLQFEPTDFISAAVDIATLYNGQEKTLSKPKKEEG